MSDEIKGQETVTKPARISLVEELRIEIEGEVKSEDFAKNKEKLKKQFREMEDARKIYERLKARYEETLAQFV